MFQVRLRTRPFAVLAALAGLLMSVAVGCEPKVGDACEAGKAACQDKSNALVCSDGKLVAMPCKGAKGCAIEGDSVNCDYSGNQAGDTCTSSSEGAAQCSADNKSLVMCKGGKFMVVACRGPAACKVEGNTSKCDNSIAEEGEPCDGAGFACKVDGSALLKCEGGKTVVNEKCEGGAKCKIEGDKAGCMGGEAAPAATDEPAAGDETEPDE